MHTPRIITAYRFRDGAQSHYQRPTYREIEMNYMATEGTQYDRIERGAVTGGVPLVWARVEHNAPQAAH